MSGRMDWEKAKRQEAARRPEGDADRAAKAREKDRKRRAKRARRLGLTIRP